MLCRSGIQLTVNEALDDCVFQESELTVHALVISPLRAQHGEHVDKKQRVAESVATSTLAPQAKKLIELQTNKVDDPQVTLCYLCHTQDLKGKFDPKKAHALGLPKGPLFSKLSSGLAVEHDGVTVLPEQVIGPPTKGAVMSTCARECFTDAQAFLVIDCPTLAHLQLIQAKLAHNLEHDRKAYLRFDARC
jgi:hypothetical protein